MHQRKALLPLLLLTPSLGTFDKYAAEVRPSPRSGGDEKKFDVVNFLSCFHLVDSQKVFDTTYTKLLAKQGMVVVLIVLVVNKEILKVPILPYWSKFNDGPSNASIASCNYPFALCVR